MPERLSEPEPLSGEGPPASPARAPARSGDADARSTAANLRRVLDRIGAASLRAGRVEAVTLVAVAKGRPAADVRRLVELGVRDVGESRVQEARAKAVELGPLFAALGVRRHLIGPLQRNKVNAALELFDLVQSVDSLRLAGKIAAAAGARGATARVLLQVNGGEEPGKHGVTPAETEEVARAVAGLPGLDLAGLMAVTPLEAPERQLRAIFRRVRAAFDALRSGPSAPDLRHLSMGMSGDFELAVEEGATMVRVGSALFAPEAAGGPTSG
jgi:pyridoxal phosphate enzyme (YggS family)